MTEPKCTECKLKLRLEECDFSKRGCLHIPKDGYICLAFAHEGLAVHMIGVNPETGGCEMFTPKAVTLTAGDTYSASESEEADGSRYR